MQPVDQHVSTVLKSMYHLHLHADAGMQVEPAWLQGLLASLAPRLHRLEPTDLAALATAMARQRQAHQQGQGLGLQGQGEWLESFMVQTRTALGKVRCPGCGW